MTLNEICKASEYFILGEEQCWFKHFVVIQSKNRLKAKFVLYGVSGMRDIAMQSVCGRYRSIVHTTDPSYNKFDDWDIVEIFHSRKEYFEYQRNEREKANKEEYGNGMDLIFVETHTISKDGNHEYYDTNLYYIDNDTGSIYEEPFSWYDESRDTTNCSIFPKCSGELYFDEEEGEECYKHLTGGLDGLREYYLKDYKGSSLAQYFSVIEYKITKLGVL